MVPQLMWLLVFALLLGLSGVEPARAAEHSIGWRLRLHDAAVIVGENVTLGEIAVVIGPMDAAQWQKLSAVTLWPAPPKGKPMSLTRPRLQQAMAQYAAELSSLCIYPASMTLQQGGAVLREDDLRGLVVKKMTAQVAAMPGQASLQDFRLPSSIFLAHPGQSVDLELPSTLSPGRQPLRFVVKEADGVVLRRLNGTVMVDQWVEVPCAATLLNKDDILTPERVTFIRKNLAHMRETPWDGRGGPWRVTRPIGMEQPILQTDIAVIPTVRKGAMVTMIFEGKNFTVSMQGEALGDGAAGESILVRNLQSKKQVRALVRDALTVIVK